MCAFDCSLRMSWASPSGLRAHEEYVLRFLSGTCSCLFDVLMLSFRVGRTLLSTYLNFIFENKFFCLIVKDSFQVLHVCFFLIIISPEESNQVGLNPVDLISGVFKFPGSVNWMAPL